MVEKAFIYGAGGHAKVAIDILENCYEIICVVDDNSDLIGSLILGYPVMGSDHLKELKKQGVSKCFVAIGNNATREKIVNRLLEFKLINAVHKSCCISHHCTIGKGVMINAGAVINAGSVIKDHSIINTSATIDHDCIIEEYTHICPNVSLAGGVTVGRHAMVGIGSSVTQGLSIGCNSIIGGGSVVVRDIDSEVIAYGVPARIEKVLKYAEKIV